MQHEDSVMLFLDRFTDDVQIIFAFKKQERVVLNFPKKWGIFQHE